MMARYRPLVPFILEYWRTYVSAALLCFLGTVLDAVHVAVLLPLLAGAFGGGAPGGRLYALIDGALSRLPFSDTMVAAAVVLIVFTPLKGIVSILTERLIGRAAGQVLYETKRKILAKYAEAPYRFFVESRQGELMYEALTSPIKLSWILTRLPQVFVEGMRVAGIVLVLTFTSFQATAALVALALLTSGLVALVTRRASYTLGQGRTDADKAQANLLQEFTAGIKQISVYGVKDRWVGLFDKANRAYVDLFIKDHVLLAVPKTLIETLAVTAVFGFILHRRLYAPERLAEVLPLAGVFAMALIKLLPSLSTLSRSRMEVLGALPYLEGLRTALDRRFEPPHAGTRPFRALESAIRFEGVSFSYPDRPPLLSALNLDLPARKTTAIVGDSGSGKTTLINLLLGLYAPTGGRILLDGVPLDETDLPSFLRRVALVSQDTCVLHASVLENIVFGRPGYALDDARRAARVAHADEFIERLPDGYDTIVGERGMRLSGGQQQRLAIARAMLGEPDVVVFDEATSALDNVSEAAVQKAIRDVSRQKTVIQVAHRLSSVEWADKIVVLQAGRVVEEGTHAELSVLGGAYARLLRRGES